MKTYSLTITLFLLSIFILSGCGVSKEKEVNKTIDSFFDSYQSNFRKADPTFITKNLSDKINQSIVKEKTSANQLKAIASSDKPLMIEGDIFTNLYEGYTQYKIVNTTVEEQKAYVTILFTNKNYDNISWIDTVFLIKEKLVWKIDNVFYADKLKKTAASLQAYLDSFLNLESIVGNDKDAHGCKGSAGYCWSELKQKCIRPFELPLKLLNKEKTSETGVIFSEDSTKAEVFSFTGIYLLHRKSKNFYQQANESNGAFLENKMGKWAFGISKGTASFFE